MGDAVGVGDGHTVSSSLLTLGDALGDALGEALGDALGDPLGDPLGDAPGSSSSSTATTQAAFSSSRFAAGWSFLPNAVAATSRNSAQIMVPSIQRRFTDVLPSID